MTTIPQTITVVLTSQVVPVGLAVAASEMVPGLMLPGPLRLVGPGGLTDMAGLGPQATGTTARVVNSVAAYTAGMAIVLPVMRRLLL